MVQSSFLWTAAVLLTVFSSPSHAERPAGKFGGHQQMNIDQLEKDLGNKFTIPFPSKRYGIDYFYKGDLVVRKNGEDTKTSIQRIERSVLESAETSKQVKTSRNLAQLALQVIRAVTKQNLDLE